ncbi:FixH family protein [Paracoccus sp. (in: a-proteobacteria)]|uniref:FixH family protein n=1 Tax=Paracoccus sp. TaxID=267 RepID=UPI00396D01DF
MTRELKGLHVLAITVAAFGTIIGVNVVMAFAAINSFPGVETRSSYIASQHFQAEREAQQRLGWQADLHLDGGRLILSLHDHAGAAVAPRALEVMLRRPTHQHADHQPRLEPAGPGEWRAVSDLAPGNWNADVVAQGPDGVAFRQRFALQVRD